MVKGLSTCYRECLCCRGLRTKRQSGRKAPILCKQCKDYIKSICEKLNEKWSLYDGNNFAFIWEEAQKEMHNRTEKCQD